MKVYLIGLGRVGLGLALLLEKKGMSLLGGYVRSPTKLAALSQRLKAPLSNTLAVPAAVDMVIVAVPDGEIASVGRQLSTLSLPKNLVVVHTSGISPGAKLGLSCSQGSLHPLVACADADADDAAHDFEHGYFGLEGDAQAIAAMQAFVFALGANSFVVPPEHKVAYHAAAVMGSNLVVSLVAMAERSLEGRVTLPAGALPYLAQSAVQNIVKYGLSAGLTGPAARGETATIEAHRGALDPAERRVYDDLTMSLTTSRTTQTPEKVIFACVHNAGRSQMAAAFFNRLCRPGVAMAISAGTAPGARVHPEVQSAMMEVGMDLSHAKPQRLTEALAQDATMLITMGCGDACPVVPGAERQDWPLPDPKGQPIERVREIREDVKARVAALLKQKNWG